VRKRAWRHVSFIAVKKRRLLVSGGDDAFLFTITHTSLIDSYDKYITLPGMYVQGEYKEICEMKDNVNDMMAPMKTCVPLETPIMDVRLAHAYVPWQLLCGTMAPVQSLKAGTIFPELLGHYGNW
jgi:hypothetical protein